jgi:hypothetical protein
MIYHRQLGYDLMIQHYYFDVMNDFVLSFCVHLKLNFRENINIGLDFLPVFRFLLVDEC